MKTETQMVWDEAQENECIKWTSIVYLLQIISFIVLISSIAGIILNYIKLDAVKNTWLESHFRWQIRTFWFGLLWSIVGVLTAWLLVGFVILVINSIWIVYRIVRGYVALLDHQTVGLPNV